MFSIINVLRVIKSHSINNKKKAWFLKPSSTSKPDNTRLYLKVRSIYGSANSGARMRLVEMLCRQKCLPFASTTDHNNCVDLSCLPRVPHDVIIFFFHLSFHEYYSWWEGQGAIDAIRRRVPLLGWMDEARSPPIPPPFCMERLFVPSSSPVIWLVVARRKLLYSKSKARIRLQLHHYSSLGRCSVTRRNGLCERSASLKQQAATSLGACRNSPAANREVAVDCSRSDSLAIAVVMELQLDTSTGWTLSFKELIPIEHADWRSLVNKWHCPSESCSIALRTKL